MTGLTRLFARCAGQAWAQAGGARRAPVGRHRRHGKLTSRQHGWRPPAGESARPGCRDIYVGLLSGAKTHSPSRSHRLDPRTEGTGRSGDRRRPRVRHASSSRIIHHQPHALGHWSSHQVPSMLDEHTQVVGGWGKEDRHRHALHVIVTGASSPCRPMSNHLMRMKPS